MRTSLGPHLRAAVLVSGASLWLPAERSVLQRHGRVWRSGGRLGIGLLRVLRRGLSTVRYTAVPLELGVSWNE